MPGAVGQQSDLSVPAVRRQVLPINTSRCVQRAGGLADLKTREGHRPSARDGTSDGLKALAPMEPHLHFITGRGDLSHLVWLKPAPAVLSLAPYPVNMV